MGAGRKPEPTALKLVKGNPGKRPISKTEPKPKIRVPSCPAHITGQAKTEWRRVTKFLAKMGLVSDMDRAVLAGYCEAYGRWVHATKQIKETGYLVKSPQGFPMQSPWMAIANKAFEQMMKAAVEFGMTPSSRTRVATGIGMMSGGGTGGGEAADEEEIDPAEKYFTA